MRAPRRSMPSGTAKAATAYDVRGRTAHESMFNINDGNYRCPNSQQGYSPFSTWTRGLAWAMCGFAEQLELFDTLEGHEETFAIMEKAARATCDFYIEHTPPDGIPYWDTGAPGLAQLGDWRAAKRPIRTTTRARRQFGGGDRAQGLLAAGTPIEGRSLFEGRADSVRDTLFAEPYLSTGRESSGSDPAFGVSPAERMGRVFPSER